MFGRVGVIELVPIALFVVMVLGPVPFGLMGAYLAGAQEAAAAAPAG